MLRKVFSSIFVLAVAIGIAQAVPGQINYQGILKDSSGNTLSGNYSITFSIYAAASGGSALWSETQPTIPVASGLYNIQLGAGTPISSSVFDGTTRYLGVKVGSDSEMTPRIPMITVPYAFYAANTDTLAGYSAATAATTGSIIPVTNAGTGKLDSSFIPPTGSIDTSQFVQLGSDQTTTNQYGIKVTSSNNIGVGVYGNASGAIGQYGGYFTSNGTGGRGVYGSATNNGVVSNIGGEFISAGTLGRGVYGLASAQSGTNYGGYFESDSTAGMGIYGLADWNTGTNYGVYGQTNSPDGYGGYFKGGLGVDSLTDSGGQPANVYWNSGTKKLMLANPVGYYVQLGLVPANQQITNNQLGIDLKNSYSGAGGTGIYVEESGGGANTQYGGSFVASSTQGVGVSGIAPLYGGYFGAVNYGVYSQANDPSGSGVLGKATNGTGTNYGGYFESDSTNGIGVYGKATTGGAGSNLGGYFESASDTGIGVHGKATGVFGTGVKGEVTNANAYSGYFTGGTGVYIDSTINLKPIVAAALPSSGSGTEGMIRVYNITGINHIYCYLNGVWKQLDN